MTSIEFTFEWYGDLIKRIRREGYAFRGFDRDDGGAPMVILRHDVDWSPRKAVRMAEIEARNGAMATYFFLVSSPFYNVMNEAVRERIRRIRGLGHEIGLHFSTHQHFDTDPSNPDDGSEPSMDTLSKYVTGEMEVLATAGQGPIEVVSFHNPPRWLFRRSFKGFTSTYEERFFEDIAYRADSNQRWRDDPPFAGGFPERCQLLTHPVLWGDRDGWATDRLREERDYMFDRIGRHLNATDRTWPGLNGIEPDPEG